MSRPLSRRLLQASAMGDVLAITNTPQILHLYARIPKLQHVFSHHNFLLSDIRLHLSIQFWNPNLYMPTILQDETKLSLATSSGSRYYDHL